MFDIRNKPVPRNMTPVYEENYRRLVSLIPALRELRSGVTLAAGDGTPALCVDIAERFKYSSTVVLARELRSDHDLLPDLQLKVRVYFDARLAEVIGYQGESRFAPLYLYPNERMRYPGEKRRINLFLAELLGACAIAGCPASAHRIAPA